MLSKGWLKPNKLKEISGIPARELIAKELKDDRLRKKKEKYIREYHSRMAKDNPKGYSFAPMSSNATANVDSMRHITPNTTNVRKPGLDKGQVVRSMELMSAGDPA